MMRAVRFNFVITSLLFSVAVLRGSLCAAQAGENFTVSGVVVDGNAGAPVSRCQVMIALSRSDFQPEPRLGKPMTMVTASDGRFQFNNVPPGKYSLLARRNGYRTQPLNEHDGYSSAVVVGPNKDSQNILFRLQPSGSINGRVEDEYGDPVGDGQVTLFRRANFQNKARFYFHGRVNLNQDGNYHFFRQAPGEYFVVVLARPWYARFRQFLPTQNAEAPRPPDEADVDQSFAVTYYPGTTDERAAAPIQLHAGERFTADIHLAAQPGSHFQTARGENTDSTRVEQHLQASIFRYPMSLEPVVSKLYDEKNLEMTGIPAGRYDLRQRTSNGQSFVADSRAEVNVSGGGDVEVKPATDATPITGKMVLEGVNEPFRPTVMQFERVDNGEMRQVRCNANGELEPFQLFPGVYQYSASSSQGVIKSFEASGAKVVARTVGIGSEPVTLKVVLAEVAIDIVGTVHGADGKPLSGAMVVIIPEDPEHNQNIFRRDQSDLDGTFELRVVMPGKYVLVAIQDGWDLEWSRIDVMRRFLGKGQPIQVLPDQENITAELTAQSAKE